MMTTAHSRLVWGQGFRGKERRVDPATHHRGAAASKLDTATTKIGALAGVLAIVYAALYAPAAEAATPELSPVGAIVEGTTVDNRAQDLPTPIPRWNGGLSQRDWPHSYTKRGDRLADPFPDDEPVLWLTRDNYAQYLGLLSAGHRRLFALHADYRMPVFRSRRTASFPEAVYQATQANAKTAKLRGTDTIEHAELGFPFPHPSTGAEAMWNHKLKYRTEGVVRANHEAVVYHDGDFTIGSRIELAKFGYASLQGGDSEQVASYAAAVIAPANHSGNALLVHESIDLQTSPPKVWVFNAGQRRLRRAPSVLYDSPIPGSDGLQLADQLDMFHGPMDRYDWTLLGRRVMLIPYNSYRMGSSSIAYDELLQARFPNPEHTRYEPHRVWVIEAKVKDGLRHQFSRRVFYLDEDSWSIAMVDLYDSRDQLWRFQEGHLVSYYGAQTVTALPELIFDLPARRYFATALTNETRPYQPGDMLTARNFTTRALRRFAASPMAAIP